MAISGGGGYLNPFWGESGGGRWEYYDSYTVFYCVVCCFAEVNVKVYDLLNKNCTRCGALHYYIAGDWVLKLNDEQKKLIQEYFAWQHLEKKDDSITKAKEK